MAESSADADVAYWKVTRQLIPFLYPLLRPQREGNDESNLAHAEGLGVDRCRSGMTTMDIPVLNLARPCGSVALLVEAPLCVCS